MPAIIDYTYFQNEPLFIPNTVPVPDIQDGTVTATEQLDSFIDAYEKLLLVNALGIVQYNELKLNQDELSGKWHDLIEGKEYGDKVWTGLKPIIASFVFCKYAENDKSYYTGVGMERSDSKNSISVNPTEKITEIWNSFIEMYGGSFESCGNYWYFPYLYFSGWNFNRWNYDNYAKNSFVSLRQFLKDFPEDYSSEFFKDYFYKNRFGI